MEFNATCLNLASIIEHHARLTPKREAVIYGDNRITYGTLHAISNRVAHALVKMGIKKGDKVALSCPNRPYFPIVYYGILKAGAVVVPLSILLRPREIKYHLEDSDSKAVFAFEGSEELPIAKFVKEAFDSVKSCENMVVMCNEPTKATDVVGAKTFLQATFEHPDTFETVTTDAHDTAAILYTSGTTGKPKGAELSHLNIYSNAITSYLVHLPVSDFTSSPQKSCLITLPLFHTTGQTVQMNSQLYAGNRIVLLPRFEPKQTLETMIDEKINYWVGVPTMYWALLRFAEESKMDISGISKNLIGCTSGGAPLPVEVMKGFEKRFNVRVFEGYGLSETSPLVTFNHFERPSKPGSVGQPILGVEVKCFDDKDKEVKSGERGEIVVRGSNIMKGYYKRPKDSKIALRNGWFHTGDIGIIDEEGYLQIVDRKKDMILRGGYNVYPRELEEVMLTHPAISLCAVIGVPDAKMGEEVKAYIVLKSGETLTETAFFKWCAEQFAKNKCPRFVEFRDELPIGGTGKILKRALREEAQATFTKTL
ncbi:MAG: long-chain-fatty-acid--CoA ligase [Pyrinomonadaceae bacterium]